MASVTNKLLLDVDGVLTDGKVYVTHKGERFKAFHSRDNRAIAQFVAAGWEVHLVSVSGWPGAQEFSKNTGAIVWKSADKSERAIKAITNEEPFIAVGDDVFDLDMLGCARRAFCPSDADQEVKRMHYVETLDVKGGDGIVAELARILLGKGDR